MKKITLFGIPVRKEVKGKVILFLVLAVLCLFLYIVLMFFDKPIVVEYQMPGGNLSQTLFDSQNMEYKKVDGYPTKHAFNGLPFTIDTISGQSAKVGNGAVYNSGDYFLYYSEMGSEEQITEVVKRELTDVLLLAGEKERTILEIKKEENGYINGCEATYYMMQVNAYRDKESVSAILCLYSLKVNEDIYSTEKYMLVGCLSTALVSQEVYDGIQQLAHMSITTLNLDKERVKEFEKDVVKDE